MTPEQLKASILQYAIQGKLVEQRPEEGTGEELYQQIVRNRELLIERKVASYNRFSNFVNRLNTHLLFTPSFKEPKHLLIARHGLLSQLTAAAIHHILIDLPVKAQIRHKKSPDHWCCVPNKSGEFIALNKTVYRLNRKNSCVLSWCS